MSQYKYGASYNCVICEKHYATDVGDADYPTLDYISNDVDKLKQKLIERSSLGTPIILEEEDALGYGSEINNELGGNVIALVGEFIKISTQDAKHFHIEAVIFENPNIQTQIID